MEHILAQAKTDYRINLNQQSAQFIDNQSFVLPFIQNVGFRTETNRFEFVREEYLARVNFNGLTAMKYQKAVKQSLLNIKEKEMTLLLGEALLLRYDWLLNYHQWLAEKQDFKNLLAVLDDKIKVYQRLLPLGKADVLADIAKAEEDKLNLYAALIRADANLKFIEQQAGNASTTESVPMQSVGVGIDTAEMIDIERAIGILNDPPQLDISQHPELEKQRAEMGLAQSKYALDKAKAKQVIDFAQVRYSGREDEPVRNELAIGFGITLPFRGDFKIKQSEYAIKQFENQQQIKLGQQKIEDEVKVLKQEIAVIYKQYLFTKQYLKGTTGQKTIDRAADITDLELLTFLDLKEKQIKNQLKIKGLEAEIRRKYITIMALSGQLTQMPLKNYLSNRLSGF